MGLANLQEVEISVQNIIMSCRRTTSHLREDLQSDAPLHIKRMGQILLYTQQARIY